MTAALARQWKNNRDLTYLRAWTFDNHHSALGPVDLIAGATAARQGTPGIEDQPRRQDGLLGDFGVGLFSARSNYLDIGRVSLTGHWSREAVFVTSDADATKAYEGNAAMTLLGDYSGSVWDSFGVTGGYLEANRFNNSSWQKATSSKFVADGRVHHGGATYNATTRVMSVYVDGALSGQTTISAHQAQGGINAIGRGYLGDYFNGTIFATAFINDVMRESHMMASARLALAAFDRRRRLVTR